MIIVLLVLSLIAAGALGLWAAVRLMDVLLPLLGLLLPVGGDWLLGILPLGHVRGCVEAMTGILLMLTLTVGLPTVLVLAVAWAWGLVP